MSLAISSAIPNDLSRYSSVGLRLNAELRSESSQLASVLQHFEATCRESGYSVRVSHLADELRSYARQTDLLDQWVSVVGVGFFVADSGQKIVKVAEFAVGAVLVKSISISDRSLKISLAWVKAFGLKPSAVKTFLGITATSIRFENLLKYSDKVIGKAALILGIVIKWADDLQHYTGTELISALVVDAIFAVVVVKVAAGVGALILGAGSGILVAVAAVGVALVLAIALDLAFENLGIRDWAINGLNTALNWTIDRARELPELGAKTVQALDEKVFMPIARGIATGVDNVTSFVDSAAQRLWQKLQDTADAAGRVISDEAIKPTSGEALEVRQGLHDAMDGWGTDEAAIMRLIKGASDAEKAAILNDTALLERLDRELSKEVLLQVAKGLADVSDLPEGLVQDAVALMAMSRLDVHRNTAAHFISGHLSAYYIEDLQQPDRNAARAWFMENEAWLWEKYELTPNQVTLYFRPPANTEIFPLPNNFVAGAPPGSPDLVLIKRKLEESFEYKLHPIGVWLTSKGIALLPTAEQDPMQVLVHETSHALNPIDAGTPFGYFEQEFLAYWIAGFENIDIDRRAGLIKEYILYEYPYVKKAYDKDATVRSAIDAYTYPRGTLTNDLQL